MTIYFVCIDIINSSFDLKSDGTVGLYFSLHSLIGRLVSWFQIRGFEGVVVTFSEEASCDICFPLIECCGKRAVGRSDHVTNE